MKKIILLHIVFFASAGLFAQNEQDSKDLVRKGNEEFRSNHFKKAAKLYEDALDEDGNNHSAIFNLGAAKFSRNEFKEATEHFENAALTAETNEEKSNAYYNLGCAHTLAGKTIMEDMQANPAAAKEAGDPFATYKEGAEAFKNALRNDPSNENARNNLAHVQKWLKENEPPKDENQDGEDENEEGEDEDKNEKEDGENGENDKDSDKKDSENSDEEGDPSDEKDGDKSKEEEEQEQQQKEQQEQQEQQQQMSKEDAERILEAIDRKEKEIRQKMNLKKARTNKVKIEKDW